MCSSEWSGPTVPSSPTHISSLSMPMCGGFFLVLHHAERRKLIPSVECKYTSSQCARLYSLPCSYLDGQGGSTTAECGNLRLRKCCQNVAKVLSKEAGHRGK